MAVAASADDASLERGRLAVVLATVAINVVAVSLLALGPWSDWIVDLHLLRGGLFHYGQIGELVAEISSSGSSAKARRSF